MVHRVVFREEDLQLQPVERRGRRRRFFDGDETGLEAARFEIVRKHGAQALEERLLLDRLHEVAVHAVFAQGFRLIVVIDRGQHDEPRGRQRGLALDGAR